MLLCAKHYIGSVINIKYSKKEVYGDPGKQGFFLALMEPIKWPIVGKLYANVQA